MHGSGQQFAATPVNTPVFAVITGMKAPSIPWSDKERLDLAAWLEDNWVAIREDRERKKAQWWQVCKEQKFPADEHITAKRIGEKVANMRRVFNEVHMSARSSGWGLTEQDTEPSINAAIARKCVDYWRLGKCWGKSPNATEIVLIDTLSPPKDPRGLSPVSPTYRQILPIVSPSRQLSPAVTPNRQPSPAAGQGPHGGLGQRKRKEETQARDQIIAAGAMQKKVERPRAAMAVGMAGMKRLMEDKAAVAEVREEKRLRLEKEMADARLVAEASRHSDVMEMERRRLKIEEKRLDSEESLKRFIVEANNASAERIAKIQADAINATAKIQADLMAAIVGALQKRDG